MLVAANAPFFMEQVNRGRNTQILTRSIADSERYGLEIARLVLPAAGHVVPPLGRLGSKVLNSSSLPGEPVQSLGLVGVLGLCGLAVVAARRLFRNGDPQGESHGAPAFHLLAGLTALTLAIASVGGISFMLAMALPLVRTWSRAGLFVGFFALAAVALWLDRWLAAIPAGARRLVLVGVLIVGLVDQAAPGLVPPYRRLAATFRSDRLFVRALERGLPPRAAILELPYLPYPEADPEGGLFQYDPLFGFLHSDRLRWSYGAMAGRPEDWSASFALYPADAQVAAAAVAGFDAVVVQRAGYRDSGRSIEAGLSRLLGAPIVVSRDRRLSAFGLRGFGARMAARLGSRLSATRALVVHPLRVLWGSGFSGEGHTWQDRYRSVTREGSLAIVNPGRGTRAIVVRGDITAVTWNGSSGAVTVRWPGGARVVRVSSRYSPLAIALEVPPGATTVNVAWDSDPPLLVRDARLVFRNLWLEDAALLGALGSAR